MNATSKNILVAPLNWGLGHATRCIPIIRELEKKGYTPILASDGTALELLKKEFPHLIHLELPSYHIEYPNGDESFKWKILRNLPQIIIASRKENQRVKKWITQYDLKGIISDNRFGVYNAKVPSVYLTHQLRVLSGNTSKVSTELHHYVIKKFDECWVPDVDTRPNLSGKLGRLKKNRFKIKYIGPLSRFKKTKMPHLYKLLVILSGPEPQRSFLEQKLISDLKNYVGEILFVRGIIEPQQIREKKGTITFYNYMTTQELEVALNQSNMILCRSGYSSIMDLSVLEKKAFFIPTPGQVEQEYLANKMQKNGLIPFATQDEFSIDLLYKAHLFEGLKNIEKTVKWNELFSLFERE